MRLLIATLLLFNPALAHTADIVDLGQLQLVTEPFNAPASISDLGRDVRRGVEAQVQLEPQPLLDISEPLDGNLRHFLISVFFIETKTGQELLEGQVAARIFTPDKRIAKTVRLEPREFQWSGVLVLPSEGETMIKIGTKLADGKKRIYRFFYNQQPVVQMQ